MATFDYTRMLRTANRLINKFGRAATYKRITAGAYNSATGTASSSTVSTAVTAVLLDYAQSVYNQPSTLIKAGDRRAYLAGDAVATTPKPGDILDFGSEAFTVVGIPVLLNPGGTTVVYELHLRN
jgi:hypothetical protein